MSSALGRTEAIQQGISLVQASKGRRTGSDLGAVRPEGLLPLCTATARSNLFYHPYECPNAPREIGTAVWLLNQDLRVTEVCRFLG